MTEINRVDIILQSEKNAEQRPAEKAEKYYLPMTINGFHFPLTKSPISIIQINCPDFIMSKMPEGESLVRANLKMLVRDFHSSNLAFCLRIGKLSND